MSQSGTPCQPTRTITNTSSSSNCNFSSNSSSSNYNFKLSSDSSSIYSSSNSSSIRIQRRLTKHRSSSNIRPPPALSLRIPPNAGAEALGEWHRTRWT